MGHFSLLRAYNLAVRGGWQGQQYVSEVSGEVAEGALFDQQLHPGPHRSNGALASLRSR
jgi:hypothetical protein